MKSAVLAIASLKSARRLNPKKRCAMTDQFVGNRYRAVAEIFSAIQRSGMGESVAVLFLAENGKWIEIPDDQFLNLRFLPASQTCKMLFISEKMEYETLITDMADLLYGCESESDFNIRFSEAAIDGEVLTIAR
jgi:hypothetical protein